MTISELAAFLADKDDIVIIGHVSPDGDAVGSALSLKLAFDKLGKRACVALADPVPERYMFLSGAPDVCAPDALPFAHKCALAADVSEKIRMGAAEKLFDAAEYKAVLDHHETNPGFGDIWHVDGARASTGELALELIREMGVEPDAQIAECVFVALCTDTGNFNYRNTDRCAYMAAGECVKYGAQVERLTRLSFRERSMAATKLLGEALSRIETACDGKIAYTFVDDGMLERAGATLEDASRISNYLSEITGVKVGVYFEQRQNATKVSWRSACGLNVAKVAGIVGGGGHDAAAGATVQLSIPEAIESIVGITEAALKGYEADAHEG